MTNDDDFAGWAVLTMFIIVSIVLVLQPWAYALGWL